MKLHYKGKYDLNPESLPHNPHKPNAVAFKEAKDSKTLSKIANGVAFLLLIPLAALVYLRYGMDSFIYALPGSLLALLSFFPHEFLHAICFKEDVYVFTNWKQGMLFVVGPETMSKGRFISMSLLPSLIFGFIPFAIGMIYPSQPILVTFGAISITAGAGDYYNIFNALTQMPKGARTYIHQFNSYWYVEE